MTARANETGIELYVSNLSLDVGVDDVRELLGGYGEVAIRFMPSDPKTGRANFAFVAFSSTEAASRAVYMLQGKEYRGRLLDVQVLRRFKPSPRKAKVA